MMRDDIFNEAARIAEFDMLKRETTTVTRTYFVAGSAPQYFIQKQDETSLTEVETVNAVKAWHKKHNGRVTGAAMDDQGEPYIAGYIVDAEE